MPQPAITEKRFNSANISSGGGTGSTSLTLATVPTGLQPFQQIWLNGGSQAEDLFVGAYVVGSTTVPLNTPVQFGTQTQIFFDGHNVNGPQAGPILPFNVYPDIPLMYDNVQNAYIQMQGKQGVLYTSNGGDKSVSIPAATTTDTVVKASAGRLAAILVTTLGAFAPLVFDNASVSTGTIIAALIASAPLGLYVFNTPALNGITVRGALTAPAMTIFYW